MREIKFRVWNEGLDEMDEPYCVKDGIPYWYDIDSQDISEYGGSIHIMQYTGLKDKNGVEIYEGDIVKTNNVDIGIVKFGNYMAGGNDYYASGAYGFYVQRLFEGKIISEDDTETVDSFNTVVGNIYQNKELIKQ